ncbi:hypothetical protein RM549_07680 [Salegentibacter sp. F188]|uniref:Uncharacterized protein n=1 Tax=Autumnicola patrickiae TaxID=3075591 RepID=A0ABU3E120_9FLAO|nr:hypothetical protein [Salegentibacter sp. F188]MDT0689661.1 hypothetical protein [Salegentibacter sp. F188]
MKKFALLLISVLTFVSCDTEDDGLNIAYEYAAITEYDFPEYFEAGEEYDFEVTFELPSACHSYVGIDWKPGQGTDGRDVYVGALTSYDPNLVECDVESEDLTRVKTIQDIKIPTTADDGDIYTFFILTGADEDGDAEYTEVEIPVGAPDDAGDDTDSEDDDAGDDTGDEASN